VLVQQRECGPNGGSIPCDLAVETHVFYEEPAAGFDEPGNAFEDGFRVRELRVIVISQNDLKKATRSELLVNIRV